MQNVKPNVRVVFLWTPGCKSQNIIVVCKRSIRGNKVSFISVFRGRAEGIVPLAWSSVTPPDVRSTCQKTIPKVRAQARGFSKWEKRNWTSRKTDSPPPENVTFPSIFTQTESNTARKSLTNKMPYLSENVKMKPPPIYWEFFGTQTTEALSQTPVVGYENKHRPNPHWASSQNS